MHFAHKSLLIILFTTSFLQAVKESELYTPGKRTAPFGARDIGDPNQRQAFLNYWLYVAVWHKDLKNAQEFLDLGAKPDKGVYARGKGSLAQPLWVAVALEDVNMVKLLLDYGATPQKARGVARADVNEYVLEKQAQLKSIPQEIFNRYKSFNDYNLTIFQLINQMPQNNTTREIAQLLNDYTSGAKKPTHEPGARANEPLPSFQAQPTSPQPQQPPIQPQTQLTPTGKTNFQQFFSQEYAKLGDMKFWLMAWIGDIDGFENAVKIAKQKGLINNLYGVVPGQSKMTALAAATLKEDSGINPNQYLQIINILLQAGADPNLPDQYGNSPLIIAARTKAPIEFFQTLLNAGANPNVTDQNGVELIKLIQDPQIVDFIKQYKPGAVPPPAVQPTQPQTPVPTMTPLQTNLTSLANELNKLASAI